MGIVLGKIDVETPAHKVLRKAPFYEIREYPGAVAACTYSSDYDNLRGDAFMNAGFRTLAGYIGVYQQGQNIAKTTIAMTAPVVCKTESQQIAMTAPVIEKNLGERDMMAFLLPKEFTMENAPEPTNPKVHLEQMPPRVLAVHTFSGAHDMDSCQPIAKQLVEELRKDNIKVQDENKFECAFYNPPFTLPFLRTNEVFVPVADGQVFAPQA